MATKQPAKSAKASTSAKRGAKRKPRATAEGRAPARRGPVRDPATGRVSGGNPGNKGGSGRPSNGYRAFLRELRNSAEHQAALRTIAGDPASPHFMALVKHLADRTLGAVQSKVQHSGTVGLEAIVAASHVVEPGEESSE